MVFDVLLRGGRVVDGSGGPWVRGDVALAGGRIAAIGWLPDAAAARVIDVTDKIVAPGFIDCHSHSDWSLLANRRCESTIRAGVTTEVVGNCGMTYAPLSPHNRARTETDVARTSLGVQVTWTTFGEYLDVIEQGGISGNYAFLAGHAAIRSAVMGSDERPATPDEVTAMQRLLEACLDAGAFGLSTGLEFVPGRAATEDELVALSRVVARRGRLHSCHQRTRNEGFEQSVAEIVGVCERAGARLQISHNNARRGAPPGAWDRVMRFIGDARARGLDVSCDTTSYIAGLGVMAAVLPPWLFDQGPAKAAERLGDPEIRRKVKGDLRRYWLQVADGVWDKVWLGRTTNSQHLFGKSFAEIGQERSQDPLDCFLNILMDEGAGIADAGMFGEVKTPDHLRELVTHSLYSLEADAWTASAKGPLAAMVNHPASFGWTARVLGEYVRERRWLPLEEAIKKMTAQPAAKFGLRDRGLLRPGLAADVVVFDADAIQDNATFARPCAYPTGIEHVFVNGLPVVVQGHHRGALPGQVLRL